MAGDDELCVPECVAYAYVNVHCATALYLSKSISFCMHVSHEMRYGVTYSQFCAV